MIEPIKIIIRDENGQATGIDQYGQINKTGKQPYEVIEDKMNEIIQVVNKLVDGRGMRIG